MKLSLNMTLYLCYYLRLNDKAYRADLAKKLDIFSKKEDFYISLNKKLKNLPRK